MAENANSQILENSAAVQTPDTTETKQEEKKEAKAAKKTEKTVKIRLPLTREDKADVYISVNERSWLIKRGEEVEVPECVAEVLRNQEAALRKSIDFIVANEAKLPE